MAAGLTPSRPLIGVTTSEVRFAERHLAPRWIGLRRLLDALGEAHLGGRDADQRSARGQASSHVSLPPPLRELLTISEPRVNATRVSATGAVTAASPTPITNGRRST